MAIQMWNFKDFGDLWKTIIASTCEKDLTIVKCIFKT